ncbi:hypothetical protein ACOME3_009236 [Neoechinorhynchus agilis]
METGNKTTSAIRKKFNWQRSVVHFHSNDECATDEDSKKSPRDTTSTNSEGFSDFRVRKLKWSSHGRQEIEVAEQDMVGVMSLRRRASKDHPLKGANIACCIHITAQMAVVIETLVAMGASVRCCACNVYSTQDEIAAALAERNIAVFAWKDQTDEEFWWCIENTISGSLDTPKIDEGDGPTNTTAAPITRSSKASAWVPNMILDDGSEMTNFLQKYRPEIFKDLKGIVEESVAGVQRLYSMARKDQLTAPAINICDSVTKIWFDNVYLCREAVLDALKRSTDAMIGGRTVVVFGYGETGKTVCKSLRSMGCSVYVTEIDPICALQACMEGYKVVRLEDTFTIADTFITCTSNKSVIDIEAMRQMKNGSIVCSIGHSPSEIDTTFLSDAASHAISIERVRDNLDHIIFQDGRRISLINQGRNIAVQSSVPSFVISITACNQVLALIELFSAVSGRYKPDVYLLPRRMDEYVASLHLSFFDAHLTELSAEQCEYLGVKKAGPFKSINYRY